MELAAPDLTPAASAPVDPWGVAPATPAPAAAAPAPVPVDPWGIGPGGPVASRIAPPAPDPWGVAEPSLTSTSPADAAAGVSMKERMDMNARAASDQTLLGASANTLDPVGARAKAEQFGQLPRWQDTPGFLNKIDAGGAALAGSLAGSLGSPESLVPIGKGYSLVRAGVMPVIEAGARAAGFGALVQGGANLGAQAINTASGVQNGIDPWGVAQAAGTGAVFGAAGAVAGKAVNLFRGERPNIAAIDLRNNTVASVPDHFEPGNVLDRVPDAPTRKPPGGLPYPHELEGEAIPVPEETPAPAPAAETPGPVVQTPVPEAPMPPAVVPPEAHVVAPATPVATAPPAVPVPAPPAVPVPEVAPAPTPAPVPAPPAVVTPAPVAPVAPAAPPAAPVAAPVVPVPAPVVPVPAPVPAPPVAEVPAPARPTGAAEPAVTSPAPAAPTWQAAHPDIPTDTFHGSGRPDVGSAYNGTNVPVLGGGKYTAFTAEHAAEYGPTVEAGKLDLKNPLIVKNDAEWRALTKEAGWPNPNPHGTPAPQMTQLAGNLKALVQSKGHDGVVVHWDDSGHGDLDPKTSQPVKTLRNVFGDPQAVDYNAAAPVAAAPPASVPETTGAAAPVAHVPGTIPPQFPRPRDLDDSQLARLTRRINQKVFAVKYIAQWGAQTGTPKEVAERDAAVVKRKAELDKLMVQHAKLTAAAAPAVKTPVAEAPAGVPEAAAPVAHVPGTLPAEIRRRNGEGGSPLDNLAKRINQKKNALINWSSPDLTLSPEALAERHAEIAKRHAELDKLMVQYAKLKATPAEAPTAAPAKPPALASSELESGTAPASPSSTPAVPASPATGTGTARPPVGGNPPLETMNKGTSPYREVFTHAGKDPDAMVSRPLAEQNRVIADHIKATFGFKDVTVNPRQDPKEVRDQLSNFYQNARSLANALQMPYSGIGIGGRVTFTTKPFNAKSGVLGTYHPGSRTLNIPGRSNAFAHEYAHALDHYLSDLLGKNPKAMKLLSMTKGLGAGQVGGRNILPGSPAEAFANLMKGIYGKDAATAAEALRLQHDVLSPDQNTFLKARKRLDEIETNYAQQARTLGAEKYWANPAEMLARAHEAYAGEMVLRQGGDVRAIAASDTVSKVPKDVFNKLFPQGSERDAIFQKFTDLFDTLRAQDIMGTGATGAQPSGLNIVDPSKWHMVANTAAAPKGLVAGLKAIVKAETTPFSNVREQLRANVGLDSNAASSSGHSVMTRTKDAVGAMVNSIGHIAQVLAERQPAGAARTAFTQLTDRFVPRQGLRSPGAARGHYVGKVFEEAVKERSRPLVNKLVNVFADHGFKWGDLTGPIGTKATQDVEKLMFRHVLTEGSGDGFRPPAKPGLPNPVVPIPANIVKAAGKVRFMLDEEWEKNREANIDVGYAKSGFYPRQYDDHKIYGDPAGFKKAATTLHSGIFDSAVGDDPEKLLAAHDRMPKDVREDLDPNVQDQVKDLRDNLKEQDKLKEREGTAAEQPEDADRLETLGEKAADLHDQLKAPVRDAYAENAANDWFTRVNAGDPTKFDTRGPNGSYTVKRVLPPEADKIMRDYMKTDPSTVLPTYFQQSARKIAFNEMFGKNGQDIERLLKVASDNGSRGEDIAMMRRLIENVTGRPKTGLPPAAENAINIVHALGSIALMPRAAWSSISEPMAMLAKTGSLKATFDTWANIVGGIVGTAGSKDRIALANAAGITTSHLFDSVIADRTEAHYEDTPVLGKVLTRFYQINGLTQLTNAQRRSVMGAGHVALGSWADELLAGQSKTASPRAIRLARDAAAQFRDLGVPDAKHVDFAKWVAANKGLPTIAELDSAGGRVWSTAITRLTDAVIQDPLKVDKPLMSQTPIGRLAFGLMSFNYSFYKKIVEATLDRGWARTKEGYTDARDAGANKAQATGAFLAAGGREGGKVVASAAAILAGAYVSTVLREHIMNPTEVAEHREAGDLTEWLLDRAMARTGFNGPLDPIAQAISGLKYQRDLSGLLAGAQAGYFLQSAGKMLAPFGGAGSPDTNTARYNAVQGAWDMFGVPAAGVALSSLPGGPLARAAYGAVLQTVTSQGGADYVANHTAGPKGTKNDGTPPTPPEPPDPDEPKKGTGKGILGGVPLGAVDDFLAPAAKVAIPLFQRLPGAAKVAVVGAAVTSIVSALAKSMAYKDDEE